jgi:hypothetical protein
MLTGMPKKGCALNDDAGRVRIFPELSTVRLSHGVDVSGHTLPEGAMGTVVAAYSDGMGYEVEFENPVHPVVTLEACDLAI